MTSLADQTSRTSLTACPFCLAPVETQPFACPSCSSPHHQECFNENGGCAVLGCRSDDLPKDHSNNPQAPAANDSQPTTQASTVVTDYAPTSGGSEGDKRPRFSPDRTKYWHAASETWLPVPDGVAGWDGSEWIPKPENGDTNWDGSQWALRPSTSAVWDSDARRWVENSWLRGRRRQILIAGVAAGALLIGVPFLVNALSPAPKPNAVTGTVLVGEDPSDIAVSRDNETVYVSNTEDNDISVFDVSAGAVVNTVDGGFMPWGLAIDRAGDNLYVAEDEVAVLDTTTLSQIESGPLTDGSPYWLALAPNDEVIYASNTQEDTITVMNTNDMTTIATVRVGSHPLDLVVTPDGKTVIVANYYDDTVSLVDTDSNREIDVVDVGDGPKEIAISPDGERLYVTNASDDSVSVIDATTNTVLTEVTVSDAPTGIAVSPDGGEVFVANSDDGTVAVINTETNIIDRVISVGGDDLYTLEISPDGSSVYVVDAETSTLSVITEK